jgi:hypothetical protein
MGCTSEILEQGQAHVADMGLLSDGIEGCLNLGPTGALPLADEEQQTAVRPSWHDAGGHEGPASDRLQYLHG